MDFSLEWLLLCEPEKPSDPPVPPSCEYPRGAEYIDNFT